MSKPCAVTRPEFLSHAQPLTVTIEGIPQAALPKEFSTGSLGWFLSGKTTMDAGRTLALDGGRLNTGTLVVNGSLLFNSGTLRISQASASINTPIVTGNPTTIASPVRFQDDDHLLVGSPLGVQLYSRKK